MTEPQTLGRSLAEYGAKDEMRPAVAGTVTALADACCAFAEIVAIGPRGGLVGS